MKKNLLLTPGPTPIPPEVLAAMSQPIIHHRTSEFEAVFEEIRAGLRELFETRQDVLVLTSTGTGAMDAAVSSLFSPGDSVVTVNAGKFGERWTQIAKAYGLNPIEIWIERGRTLSITELEKTLGANPLAKAVFFQASETSTGVELPTQKIAELCSGRGILSVCDAITACGVFPLPMDAWGIDVVMTGSQKALMLPPGLSFLSLSERAWKASKNSSCPKFYFDLSRERKMQAKNQTAWSPATTLILGLQASLKMIRAEGLQATFARHDRLARATRAGAQAIGLSLLAQESPSRAVTAVRVPPSVQDGKKIIKILSQKHGLTIAGGQDELEGKILRLSHFGYCTEFDITTALSALELTLTELGAPVVLGSGVTAALKVFSETPPGEHK